jgi:cancer susceptibility candidate protein 1
LIKEKERFEYEKKLMMKQAGDVNQLNNQIKEQKDLIEETKKKLRKKEHMILLSDQGYQTLKKMHEKDKSFWDDQLKEQRKKNEKLTMELANIFQNSIQNKNAEEELRKMFDNKYKQLTKEMNKKEESFKNKFAKNLRTLKKNEENLNILKQQLEMEKKNLNEKKKNLEKIKTQLMELKGKESRLLERLELQEVKYSKELEQTKSRYLSEKIHLENKIVSMESKIEKLENDNKKKQNQLFAGKSLNNKSFQSEQFNQETIRKGITGEDRSNGYDHKKKSAIRKKNNHITNKITEQK